MLVCKLFVAGAHLQPGKVVASFVEVLLDCLEVPRTLCVPLMEKVVTSKPDLGLRG